MASTNDIITRSKSETCLQVEYLLSKMDFVETPRLKRRLNFVLNACEAKNHFG